MSAQAHPRGPARPVRQAWLRAGLRRRAEGEPRGQALVELAFVLLPVLLILVGIIQFGFLFGANVTLTNSAREGARAGTIYLYDLSHTKAWNDAARCGAIATAAMNAMGLLTPSAPHFTVTLSGGSCPTPVGEGQVNGDVTISYCDHMTGPADPCPNPLDPTTVCTLDGRDECLVRVELVYHSDIFVPLVSTFLATDANGRFAMRAAATMVIQ